MQTLLAFFITAVLFGAGGFALGRYGLSKIKATIGDIIKGFKQLRK